MSQKNCSLAFDETEVESDASYFKPDLKIFVTDAFVKNSSLDNEVFVEGRITVSF